MRSHKHGYPFYFPIAERRWKEIEEAKGAFPTIKLLIGLELGDVSNNVELARQHLQQYDYDFVLGSVHHIRDERNQRFENLCPTDLVVAYLEEMDALVDFGAFDSLAHLDYPAKMWDVPQSVFSYFQDRIDAILKRIVEKNIALEINSSMLFKPAARLLPQRWVLEHYRAFGGTMITLGSDAHHAHAIARGLEQAKALARDVGFDHVVYYEKQKSAVVSI